MAQYTFFYTGPSIVQTALTLDVNGGGPALTDQVLWDINDILGVHYSAVEDGQVTRSEATIVERPEE